GCAQILVKPSLRGSTPGEFPVGIEIQRASSGVLRRPRGEAMPLVAAGLEQKRLGNVAIGGGFQSVALALQVLNEEREFDVLLEILGRIGVEIQVSQGISAVASPPAVAPRTHHQRVRSGYAIL